jgi:primosomal replication protein N
MENVNTTTPQEEQPPVPAAKEQKSQGEQASIEDKTKTKNKKHPQSVTDAFGIEVDERKSLLSNVYTNFVRNYKREPWIKQENFEKILSSLEKIGQSLDKLNEAGVLDNLIDGKVTNKVVPIIVIIDGRNVESTGKLVVHQNANDDTNLKMYAAKEKPNLEQYFGHTFTEEEVQNIKKTGAPGNVVMAEFKPEEGKIPVLLKLDKDTNHFFVTRQNFVKIPDTFFGAKLSDEQKEQLRSGKLVKVEGMVSQKTGKTFYADVQYSAEKKGLELIFQESQKQEQGFPVQKIANVELTKEQQADFMLGKTIYVANLRDKQGKEYNAYVRRNPETKKYSFFSKNPDDPAVQKTPAGDYKTQVAANNDGHKPKALEKVKGALEEKQPATPTAQQTAQHTAKQTATKGRALK